MKKKKIIINLDENEVKFLAGILEAAKYKIEYLTKKSDESRAIKDEKNMIKNIGSKINTAYVSGN